ncbi:MAG: CotH kinase family protein [Oscillospiraceae bacterium]|nr:CotH kinase family protein [Oscillospiraceae bacterium]
MIESKKINIITAVVMAAVIMLTAALTVSGMASETSPSEPYYAEKVFGTDIISVDIAADEESWQNMLDNAMSEEYIMADVVINGKAVSSVGIRPKGNNSLQQVASSDSDRYSFKIKFDKYVEGQTFYGLDMLVLNNMVGDATYMKEYITFDMMKSAGIETPYFGYSSVTVNGEDWGFYFALEAYDDSYKQRVSGDDSGELYNVKSSLEMGGADMKNAERGEKPSRGDNSEKPDFSENTDRKSFRGMDGGGGMGGGGMGASQSGGSLQYTSDDPSDYSAIFENSENGSTEKDYQKVIAALKALDSGENIEKYFDVDEILRYLAVHTAVVNLDSYSSGMAQNYYIYEYDGVLQILPWDYNYAWGGFQSGSSSDVVNFPVDTPVSGVEMSEKPLISKFFENEEYLDMYHTYLRELVDGYFADGAFAQKINELDSLIGEYVKNDVSAFYTYDEYQKAIEAFKLLGNLRAESISGQLDGTVPSTTDGQKAEQGKLIDASAVDLRDLGSGGMGDKGGTNFPQMGGMTDMPTGGNMPQNDGMPSMPTGGDMPQNGGMPSMPTDGNMPQENNAKTDAPNSSEDKRKLLYTAGSAALLVIANIGAALVKRRF